LTVPLVLAAGLAWALVDPSRAWLHAPLAAGAVALVLAVAVATLGLRALRGGRLPVGYFVACGALLISALVAGLGDAPAAGLAQARAYEHDAAYALAAQALAQAGAPATD